MTTQNSADSSSDKYRYTYWNLLLKIATNHSKNDVKLKAANLLKACNTAGGYDMIWSEVYSFLSITQVPKKLTKPLILL